MSEESREAAFEALAEKALRLLDEAIDRTDPENVVGLVKLVGALLDLQAALGLRKDELDREEQLGKIAKLQAAAQKDAGSSNAGTGVVILPEMADPEDLEAAEAEALEDFALSEDPAGLDSWLESIRQP